MLEIVKQQDKSNTLMQKLAIKKTKKINMGKTIKAILLIASLNSVIISEPIHFTENIINSIPIYLTGTIIDTMTYTPKGSRVQYLLLIATVDSLINVKEPIDTCFICLEENTPRRRTNELSCGTTARIFTNKNEHSYKFIGQEYSIIAQRFDYVIGSNLDIITICYPILDNIYGIFSPVDYYHLKKESILELYTVLNKLVGTSDVDSSFIILKKYQYIDFFYDNGDYFLNILLLHKKIPPEYIYKLDRYYQTKYYRTKDHYFEILKIDSLNKIDQQSELQKLEEELKKLIKFENDKNKIKKYKSY